MDWPNEDYVRMYTRETSDDAELSWEALALWRALLCKFDRSGLFTVRNGWTSVARTVRIPDEVVVRAGAELIRDGRVRLVKQGVFAPNFTEAQTASKSDRVRQRESRDRRREEACQSQDSESIRFLPVVSRAVTDSHGQSQNVTLPLLSLPLPPVIGPQEEPAEIKIKAAPGPKRANGSLIPLDWFPRPEERATATEHGLSWQSESEHFRDHHTAKGTRFRDWDAGFRTWLRNAGKWNKPQALGGQIPGVRHSQRLR